MKILLCGDVCPFDKSIDLFDRVKVDDLFGDVRVLFDKSDFAFINLECALTESEGKIKKFGPNLKAPINTAKTLKELGVTCCGLSNNHIFDYGVKGATDTIAALEAVGIGYTGFGSNYEDSRRDFIIDSLNERTAIIAVCEHEYSYALEDRMGSRPYDVYDTMADIREAKKNNNRVVVLYHGGKELCRYPSPRVRKLCRSMIDNGADVVLCQHSHCIATYENYNGGHILHGQGNFHFTKLPGSEMWNTALLTMYDTVANEIMFTPIITDGQSVCIAKGEERDKIMSEFALRNQELISGKWIDGWHAFCESNKDGYISVIANAGKEDSSERDNALFSHYLDCEAHTDVLRELFPSYNLTNERKFNLTENGEHKL